MAEHNQDAADLSASLTPHERRRAHARMRAQVAKTRRAREHQIDQVLESRARLRATIERNKAEQAANGREDKGTPDAPA